MFCVCVEMKRLTREKMKEMEEVMSKKEHPDTQKYKAALEKGQANLEKYKKMTIMTQNVLRVNRRAITKNYLKVDASAGIRFKKWLMHATDLEAS